MENFKVWNPNSNEFPKPDMTSIQVKNCYQCKSTDLNIIELAMIDGRKQFKAVCKVCGNKSGAIPYAQDAESIGANVVYFGKHKGKTLKAVYAEAPDYLDWCVNNLNDAKFIGTIVLFKRAMESKA